jgi:hypothetical protein
MDVFFILALIQLAIAVFSRVILVKNLQFFFGIKHRFSAKW